MSRHSPLWWALDDLGAPYFWGLPCPTCGADEGEYCTGRNKAHYSRCDAGLREAKRSLYRKEA